MSKRVLITAGSTVVPIDKVRAITNIFKGKTGTAIAEYLDSKGYDVTIVTSNPEKIPTRLSPSSNINVIKYKTYDDLYEIMEREIKYGNYDVIIHSAAVSDYKVEGVYIHQENGQLTPLVNNGKVSSSYPEIFFRCVQTEKIIDKIRTEWNFLGYLVKFKLEVDKTDAQLLEIARKSRAVSDADMIVANCLEWSADRAYAVTFDKVTSVLRKGIAEQIEAGYEYSLRSNG